MIISTFLYKFYFIITTISANEKTRLKMKEKYDNAVKSFALPIEKKEHKEYDLKTFHKICHLYRSINSRIDLPDVQPILDVLVEGGEAIYEQISELIENNFILIQESISTHQQNQAPEIENIINDGNNVILSDLQIYSLILSLA